MTKFRIIEARNGKFYVEQTYRHYGEEKWGGRIGPIATLEDAEELIIELRVDIALARESASEAGLRYIGA